MTLTEVALRIQELKSQPVSTCCDTDWRDYIWLLGIASRAVDEAKSLAGYYVGMPDEMFKRIFEVEK